MSDKEARSRWGRTQITSSRLEAAHSLRAAARDISVGFAWPDAREGGEYWRSQYEHLLAMATMLESDT